MVIQKHTETYVGEWRGSHIKTCLFQYTSRLGLSGSVFVFPFLLFQLTWSGLQGNAPFHTFLCQVFTFSLSELWLYLACFGGNYILIFCAILFHRRSENNVCQQC